MLTSFVFPLLVFSLILGVVWWFVRAQGGPGAAAVRTAPGRPAGARPGEDTR